MHPQLEMPLVFSIDCRRTLDSALKCILNKSLQGLSTLLFQPKSKLIPQKSHRLYSESTDTWYIQKKCLSKIWVVQPMVQVQILGGTENISHTASAYLDEMNTRSCSQ